MSETRPKRQIPFWLTLSVMANLLLVGLVAGALLRGHPGGPAPDGMRGDRPPMLEGASREDRVLVRRIMMEAFRSAQSEVENRRGARASLAEALQIDPYDREAVRRAFVGLRKSDEAVHSEIHETLVDRLDELGIEQRKALAEMLSREPGDHRRRSVRRFDHDRDRPEGSPDRD
jgi:uncharacterized membrane protein